MDSSDKNPHCIVYDKWSDESSDDDWWETVHFTVTPKNLTRQQEMLDAFYSAFKNLGYILVTLPQIRQIGTDLKFSFSRVDFQVPGPDVDIDIDHVIYDVNQSGLFYRITYHFT
jgi:hypothetical protein